MWTRLENTEKVQFERSVDKIRVGDKAAPPDCWGVAANVNADWRQQDEVTRPRGHEVRPPPQSAAVEGPG